uniref:Uncharacterized protein n=1 Tax=Rhizobium leguminosarum TaxID=384 RepID=A0A154IIS5_RHILE|nr:hypothetical protein A4A59_20815 [Rhizobium leguminosarum]
MWPDRLRDSLHRTSVEGNEVRIRDCTKPARPYATQAIRELLDWARNDPWVVRLSAETGVGNIASQLGLPRNGFVESGIRSIDSI